MGVVIEATGIAVPSGPSTHGARRLADAAARRCLEEAVRAPNQVDMLVNAGVYRERGLGEPALAALIQEDVDANPAPREGAHGTFSFDIDNGGCGFLTAVDLLGGFLTSGAIRVGMVVASDSPPGPLQTRGFPYAEAGGAALLHRDESDEGFAGLRLRTFPEYAGLVDGVWEWRSHRRVRPGGLSGSNRLVVLERPGFGSRAVDCAYESTVEFLDDLGVRAEDVDLLVATPAPQFADPLAARLGIPDTRVLHLDERLARTHTAAPIAAIDRARREGRWAEAHTILMVCAGSGITIGTAFYRR
jgi:3-oxoacyl-[acyl-carrier-protein] synthase-3